MPDKPSGQAILAVIEEKIGATPKEVTYDDEGSLIRLDLSELNMTQLPSEIGQLTSLQAISLGGNQLKQLPPEISHLTNLQILDLSNNQLSQLPLEISHLTNLQVLDLSNNQLNHLPSEISHLTNLQVLHLFRNQISRFPLEIIRIINLQELHLSNNQLNQLPSEISHLTNLQELHLSNNQLNQLPPEIGNLINLKDLDVNNNQLNQLPPEIGNLINLQTLQLISNQLSQFHREIGNLVNLKILALNSNYIEILPIEVKFLINLEHLALGDNQLKQFPDELWQLSNLQRLYLWGLQLAHLPPEIGQLTNLETLNLRDNRLTQLPLELSKLTNLRTLLLEDNPHLLTPPPEIVAQGTQAVLAFMRELQENSVTRYEAKLLVVGEGGTGKSSLLRALRAEAFDSTLSTTHGIEVARLGLPHPERPETPITLNTWDFGGQQIYHATHQFFLTRRSLYVVVWNARLGAEQGRLNYWLDTIKALAPDAPVLLVATHVDERVADLNYQLYKDAYPQLVGNLSVSNKDGTGLVELKAALTTEAAKLPLMGQPWPQKWLVAEETLLAHVEHHISAARYAECCTAGGVEADIAKGTLGNYLHDLGKILYFRDDYVLSNLVVLKPNWVTKAISRVLTDQTTIAARGILAHSELPRIWATDEDGQPYEPHLYEVFLRLMERFDLSYQIEADIPGDHPTHSLMPQLLPHQPPADLPHWPKTPPAGQMQVEMIYRFDFVPAGIMSWFIVRTHRYTLNRHWREGVMLAYEGHQARVELNPMLRELRLLVWGPQPHNFFTILKNTIDLILGRFEGLRIQREVPCICHWQRNESEPCPRCYRYEDLVSRMEAGKHTIECPNPPFIEVSVPTLLYGIHMSTTDQVLGDIKQGQQLIRTKLEAMHELDRSILEKVKQVDQLSELIGRNFTRLWNLEMQKIEAECPNTFFLMPGSRKSFNPKNWVSREYRLYLLCQHPPGPHPAGDGYRLRRAEEWWATIGPWLNHLITFLKFGVPMGKAIGAVYDQAAVDKMKVGIGLLDQIAKSLPQLPALDAMKHIQAEPRMAEDQQVIGPALRALYGFLKEADPSQTWAGLHKTPTPDGNILWLCGEHRRQYEVRPLVLEI